MSDQVRRSFERETNEQIEVRKEKLSELSKKGGAAYQIGFKPDTDSKTYLNLYESKSKEELETIDRLHRMAGRVMAMRDFGKAGFLQVADCSGRFQCYVNKAVLGEKFSIYKDFVDVGDIVYVEGTPMKTKTGEVSLKTTQLELLTKSQRPLPEKYHGITDKELKYRQRYLDLIMNETTKNTFRARSKIIQMIRQYFNQLDFIEVETPMMHPLVGGAAARPFKTHHNALDMPLFLRIAPELYLKRLVVGGYDRVFEINRNFRNEGISIQHNPEFTMLEFYMAYASYGDLMDLTEDLFLEICKNLNEGKESITYQGEEISFKKPWERITVRDSLLKYAGCDEATLKSRDQMVTFLEGKGFKPLDVLHGTPTLDELVIFAFEELVESTLTQPTFVTAYPTSVSPLSRRNDENPEVVDRFELFIYGREIANAFNELNDPDDQYERFIAQAEAKLAGNDEACDVDMDYIRALEYGLPPTAGEGIGIDRLAMLFTDSPSIRDVIFFPQMRSEHHVSSEEKTEE